MSIVYEIIDFILLDLSIIIDKYYKPRATIKKPYFTVALRSVLNLNPFSIP